MAGQPSATFVGIAPPAMISSPIAPVAGLSAAQTPVWTPTMTPAIESPSSTSSLASNGPRPRRSPREDAEALAHALYLAASRLQQKSVGNSDCQSPEGSISTAASPSASNPLPKPAMLPDVNSPKRDASISSFGTATDFGAQSWDPLPAWDGAVAENADPEQDDVMASLLNWHNANMGSKSNAMIEDTMIMSDEDLLYYLSQQGLGWNDLGGQF